MMEKGNLLISLNQKLALHKMGMVTGAVWADVNGDNEKELDCCWRMDGPSIFSYKDRI